MARGWESKSVEDQKESVETEKKGAVSAVTPDADQADRKRQRAVLELSRKKVLSDLETAVNPRYKATLEAALKHLDKKLAALR